MKKLLVLTEQSKRFLLGAGIEIIGDDFIILDNGTKILMQDNSILNINLKCYESFDLKSEIIMLNDKLHRDLSITEDNKAYEISNVQIIDGNGKDNNWDIVYKDGYAFAVFGSDRMEFTYPKLAELTEIQFKHLLDNSDREYNGLRSFKYSDVYREYGKKSYDSRDKAKILDGTKFARKCDVCGCGMNDGYIVLDEYFCGDICMHTKHTQEEFDDLYSDDDDSAYYTNWEDCQSNWQYVVKDGKLIDMDEEESEVELTPVQLLENALTKMDKCIISAWDSTLENTTDAIAMDDFKGDADVTNHYNGWMEDLQKLLIILKKEKNAK